MSVEVSSLVTSHKYDLRDLKRGFAEAESLTRSHAQRLDSMLSNVGRGVGGGGVLGGVLSVAGGNILTQMFNGITGAMSGAVKMGFDWNRVNEQTQIGFKKMLGDGQKALDFMRQMQAFAEKSPMDLPGVYKGAQRLMAMGFEARQVIPLLRAAGDAAAGLGKVGAEAAQKVDSITLALGQMRMKGKVNAQEMSRQLVEAGVPAWDYLIDQMAREDKKFARLSEERQMTRIQEMAERGQLNAQAAIAAIYKGMNKDFGGLGAEISRNTVGGREVNIGDIAGRHLGTATGPAFEAYGKLLDKVLAVLNSPLADKFVGGVSGGTGAVFGAIDKTLEAVTAGDFAGLGLSAVLTYADGIKNNLPQAVTAGASVVTSALEGAEKAHASAKWNELGKQAAQQYYSGLGFFKGQSQQEARPQDTPLEKQLEDPRVKALLDVIKRAEGGGVATLYGGQEWQGGLDQFPPWSGKRFWNAKKGKYETTHAAGLYQFQPGTYADIGREFALPSDFSERTQDLHAVALLKKLGALDTLFSKGFDLELIEKLGTQWASIPGPLGGPKNAAKFNPNTLRKMYAQALGNPALMDVGTFGVYPQEGPPERPEPLQAQRPMPRPEYLFEEMSRNGFSYRQPIDWERATELPGGAQGWTDMVAKITPMFAQMSADTLKEQLWRAQNSGLTPETSGYWNSFVGQRGFNVNQLDSDAVTKLSVEYQNFLKAELNYRTTTVRLEEENARLMEDYQRRLEDYNQRLRGMAVPTGAAAGAPFDWSGVDISHEQARGVLDIFKQARGEVIETDGAISGLANTITLRGGRALTLFANAAEDAFDNVPRLAKKVTLSFDDLMDAAQGRIPALGDQFKGLVAEFPEGMGGVFTSALSQWDGQFNTLFQSVGLGFGQLIQSMGAQMAGSMVSKFLAWAIQSIAGAALGGVGGGWTPASELSGGSVFGHVFGAAEGAMIPATPGGRFIQVAEGGYKEVVLTTDPKHRARQRGLLGQYLDHTNLIPRFEAGGWTSDSPGSFIMRDERDYSSPVSFSTSHTSSRKEVHNHFHTNVTIRGRAGNHRQRRPGGGAMERLAKELNRLME